MRADLHRVLLHARHLREIHKIAAVTPRKQTARQLFLQHLQRAGCGEVAVLGVKMDAAALTLDIINRSSVQSAHAAVHRHSQIMPRPLGQLVHSLLQLLRERKVRHRLEYVIQRTDGVPLDGILRHAVVLKDFDVVGEHCHLKLGAILPRVALHIPRQLLPDGGIILYDCNAGHPQCLPFCFFFSIAYCRGAWQQE